MQIVQQRAILHELRDDVYRLLERAHGVQLDQLAVPEFLHDLRFSKEVLGIHGAGLEGLDRHWRGVVPQTLPHLTELAVTQFAHELQGGPVDFPLISGAVGQALRHWLLDLTTKG